MTRWRILALALGEKATLTPASLIGCLWCVSPFLAVT
jgi:hypothetical protein